MCLSRGSQFDRLAYVRKDITAPLHIQLLPETLQGETANYRTSSRVFVCLTANQRTSESMSLPDQLDLAGGSTDQFTDTCDVGCLVVWNLSDRDRLLAQGAAVNHTAERRTASKGVSATY